MSYHNQIGTQDQLNEELKEKWNRLWHFFRISQEFGQWNIEMKKASEEEGSLIVKTQEILKKYGIFDKPEILQDVFDTLSESEKTICLEGLEVVLKYMKYNAGFKLNKKD